MATAFSDGMGRRIVEAVKWVEGFARSGVGQMVQKWYEVVGGQVPVIVQITSVGETPEGEDPPAIKWYNAVIKRRATVDDWTNSGTDEEDWEDWLTGDTCYAEGINGETDLVIGKRYVGLMAGTEDGVALVTVVAGGGGKGNGDAIYITGERDGTTGYYPGYLYLGGSPSDEFSQGDYVWYNPAGGDVGKIPGLYVGWPRGTSVGTGEDEVAIYTGETWGEEDVTFPGDIIGIDFEATPVCPSGPDGGIESITISNVTVNTEDSTTLKFRGVGLKTEVVV